MRWALLLLLLAREARADLPAKSIGLAFDGMEMDVGTGSVSGWGASTVFGLGGGRLQGIGEAAGGKLTLDGDGGDVGHYGRIAAGGRVLAAQTDRGVRLLVDGGVGTMRLWLDGIGPVQRTFAFGGWVIRMGAPDGGHGVSIDFTMRFALMPRIDDANVMRVVCRGKPCAPDDGGAVDFTLVGGIGVSAW